MDDDVDNNILLGLVFTERIDNLNSCWTPICLC